MAIRPTMTLASLLSRGSSAPIIDGKDGEYGDAWRPYGNFGRGLEAPLSKLVRSAHAELVVDHPLPRLLSVASKNSPGCHGLAQELESTITRMINNRIRVFFASLELIMPTLGPVPLGPRYGIIKFVAILLSV
ncbi:hypothetical protein BDR03DRAFT_1044305 [Suillus americanus]|nr:hypothetical protein BDR03DRAFT_1044305 [Suillus americanus]